MRSMELNLAMFERVCQVLNLPKDTLRVQALDLNFTPGFSPVLTMKIGMSMDEMACILNIPDDEMYDD